MVRRYGTCCLVFCNPPGSSLETQEKCELRPGRTTDRLALRERPRCNPVFQPPGGSCGREHCPPFSLFGDHRRRLGSLDKSSLDHIRWEERLYIELWYQ